MTQSSFDGKVCTGTDDFMLDKEMLLYVQNLLRLDGNLSELFQSFPQIKLDEQSESSTKQIPLKEI